MGALRSAVVAAMIVTQGACSVVADLGARKRVDPNAARTSEASAPLPLQALRVALGPTHACAIVTANANGPVDNGAVRCWGDNRGGELGIDPQRLLMSVTPVPVGGFPSAVKALTLAKDYAFAIALDESLFGWGRVPMDPFVQANTGAASYQPSAMEFSGTPIGEVGAAAAGAAGGCYTTIHQSLWCWGAFAQGDIQQGGFVLAPGVVMAADPFESVAVGRAHACGIARHNGVRVVECWGANDHEQAGALINPDPLDAGEQADATFFVNPGPIRVNAPTPVRFGSTANAVRVAASNDSSYALLADGSVYGWGANDLQQLGIIDPRDSLPVRVDLPAKATDVAVGDQYACAVLDTGNVACWGDNSWAQLGNGPFSLVPSAPVIVQQLVGATPQSLSNVQTIAAGGSTTCATLRDDPRVWCWGANLFGKAGQSPVNPFVSYAAAVGW